MHKMILIYASIMSIIGGCASSDESIQAPCYDGWIVDASGSSKIWDPERTTREELLAVIGAEHQVVCFHQMPSGEVVVISSREDGLRSITLSPNGGKYTVQSIEYIVTNRR